MQTFLEYYKQKIQPQIAAIDIFLKSEEPPYDRYAVGELLEIAPLEWERTLRQEEIIVITKRNFLSLMQRGSSPLCGMFRRAVELSLPEEYTVASISYIFDLNVESVEKAAEKLGQFSFREEELSRLFAEIPYS